MELKSLAITALIFAADIILFIAVLAKLSIS